MPRLFLLLLLSVVCGCDITTDSEEGNKAQGPAQKVVRPAQTLEELAAQESLLKVVGVHYINTGTEFAKLMIVEDMETGQRILLALPDGKSFKTVTLEKEVTGCLWAVGDQIRLSLQKDRSVTLRSHTGCTVQITP